MKLNKRINIGEVTFNRELVSKSFGSRTFFKNSGGSYYQYKKENFLTRGIILFKVFSVNWEHEINNANMSISKVIRVMYL